MTQGSASVQGADTFVRTLHHAAQTIANLEPAEQAAAEQLAGRVASTAPRDTGYLADHVTATAGRVVLAAPYAVYVNAANPWVSRAIEADRDTVSEIFSQALTEALATVEGN